MTCRSMLTAALALLLAACASPLSLKPGTPIEEARSSLGRPTAEIRLPDGGTRLQFSGQPNNQSVVNADFDAQGRLRVVEEMMTDESFARVRAGKDTQADVLRDFGRPAEVFHYRLSNETAFMYRYYTHGGFRAAMFIYFDPAGVVKRTETGLDPWSIRNGGGRDN
ncbi:MAG: hypothetical protein ACM3O5_07655 [Betaproteobacteria bacterium]